MPKNVVHATETPLRKVVPGTADQKEEANTNPTSETNHQCRKKVRKKPGQCLTSRMNMMKYTIAQAICIPNIPVDCVRFGPGSTIKFKKAPVRRSNTATVKALSVPLGLTGRGKFKVLVPARRAEFLPCWPYQSGS